jgi:hypothetical protein
VEIDHQKREFKMTCRDNGRGFDSRGISCNADQWPLGTSRHGGAYNSTVNGRTEVRLIVPARRAYQRQGRFQFLGRHTAA